MDTSGVALHVQVSQGRLGKLHASISVYTLSYYRNMELDSISEMYSPRGLLHESDMSAFLRLLYFPVLGENVAHFDVCHPGRGERT